MKTSHALVLALLTASLYVQSVHARPGHVYARPGGDCLADHYTGDIISHDSDYCVVYPATTAEHKHSDTVSLSTPVQDNAPVVVTVDQPVITIEQPVTVEPPVDDNKHCNKGEGNGGEGCDPGNHPEKGNDDEN